MPYFSFSIVSVNIQNTRSKHLDTDYLAFTLKLGQLDAQTEVVFLGNLNSGVHTRGPDQRYVWFDSYEVSMYDSLMLNYMIVNAGSTTMAKTQTALEQAGAAWAAGQGPSSSNFVGALQDGQNWFTDQLKGILNPHSCDGMVAAEQDNFHLGDLNRFITQGTFTQQTHHPGVRSPSGCGPNSHYTVTWSISPSGPLI